ncbi:MAG: hypothetical protein R3251_02785 [Candidatus Spechtbacterales bacterium]|nr:hypothetical protein [Candidatus Spechtbacterales bacterium]
MTLTYSSRLAQGMLIAIVALGMLFAFGANAQASNCNVRALVTGTEAEALTGGLITTDVPAGTSLPLDGADAGNNALICGFSLVKWVTNILFVVIIAVAILLFAYAAFLFVTAGDNEEKKTRARTFLIWAIVGLIVASLARLIPGIAQTLLIS